MIRRLLRGLGLGLELVGTGVVGLLAVGLTLYAFLGPGVIELPPGVHGRHLFWLGLAVAASGLWLVRRRRRRRSTAGAGGNSEGRAPAPKGRGLLLVATLLLIELSLRAVLGNYAISKLQARDDNCSLRAGEVEYTGWFLRIPPVRHTVNELGYRGEARPRAKPDESTRILLVGDSSTFGQGVPDDATIAMLLEDELASAPRDAPVEVLNFGVEGLNVEDVAQRYRFASRWEHDVVLYLLNQNDLDGSSCDANTWAPDLFREVYILRVPLMTTFVALALIEIATASEPDRAAEDERIVRGSQALAREARRHDARLGVVLLGSPDRSSGQWMDRLDSPLLDVSHVAREPHNVIPWEFHFNERGGRIVAEAIAAWLPDVLGSSDGAPTDTIPRAAEGS